MEKTKAVHRNLNIAPRKVRLVANAIKGQHVTSALAKLHMMPQRSAVPLAKLIRSAVANARNKNMNTERLVVANVVVDQGITLRRATARAHGRATPIRKTMSHVTVELVEDESISVPDFVLPETQKRTQGKHRPKREMKKQPPAQSPDTKEEKTRRGFVKKVFRRKAI